jgi:hypothetical protein
MDTLFNIKVKYNDSTVYNSSTAYPTLNTSQNINYVSSSSCTVSSYTSTAYTNGNNTPFQKYYTSVQISDYKNPHYTHTYEQPDDYDSDSMYTFSNYYPNCVVWNYINLQATGVVNGGKNYVTFTFKPTLDKDQFENQYPNINTDEIYLWVIAVGASGVTNNSYPEVTGGSGEFVSKKMMIWNSDGDAQNITGSIYFQSADNNPDDSNTTYFYGKDDDGDVKTFNANAGQSVTSKNGGDGAYGSNDNGFKAGGVGGWQGSQGNGSHGSNNQTDPGNQEYFQVIDYHSSGTNGPGNLFIALPDGNMFRLTPGNNPQLIFMYCYPN